jgi:hypothetical protein
MKKTFLLAIPLANVLTVLAVIGLLYIDVALLLVLLVITISLCATSYVVDKHKIIYPLYELKLSAWITLLLSLVLLLVMIIMIVTFNNYNIANIMIGILIINIIQLTHYLITL